MRKARIATAAALAALSAGLLACGEKRPVGPVTKLPPLEACKVLTRELADPDGVFDLRPARSEVDTSVGDDFAKCLFSDTELPPHTVSLELRRYATEKRAAGAQKATLDYLPRLSRATVQPVPGVGDEAAWAGGTLNQLHARAGSLRAIVTVEIGVESERPRHAAEIARRAFAPPASAPDPAPKASPPS